MVDPGIGIYLNKILNRWFRRRSRPRGTTDHYYRGVRMSYNRTYRTFVCFIFLSLLSIAIAVYFIPGVFTGQSLWMVLFLGCGWIAIIAFGILGPLFVFSQFVVITDDALVQSGLFGSKTRLNWNEIVSFRIKPDKNEVIFRSNAKVKLRMSLAYDGWQDFLETASRHLNRTLYWQLQYALANVDAKRTAQKPKWLKRFQTKKTS